MIYFKSLKLHKIINAYYSHISNISSTKTYLLVKKAIMIGNTSERINQWIYHSTLVLKRCKIRVQYYKKANSLDDDKIRTIISKCKISTNIRTEDVQ